LNKQDLELLKNDFFSLNNLINFFERENDKFKYNNLNEDKISSDNIDLYSVINKQYSPNNEEIIIEFDTMRQRFFGKNLKLLMWITVPKGTKICYNLQKLVHFGRHLIIKPIKYQTIEDQNEEYIDIKSIHFFGGVLNGSKKN